MLKHNVGRNKERDKEGFYSTPEIYTEWLLENEEFEGIIGELCCGDGRMVKVLRAEGYHVRCSDIVDRGFKCLKRSVFDWHCVDNFVTNPPYEIAEEIIEHGLRITVNKMALLLRLNFLESQSRYHRIWKKSPPTRVYVASQRVTMMPAIMRANGKMKAANAISYAWFVWDMQLLRRGIKSTQLRWLRPK